MLRRAHQGIRHLKHAGSLFLRRVGLCYTTPALAPLFTQTHPTQRVAPSSRVLRNQPGPPRLPSALDTFRKNDTTSTTAATFMPSSHRALPQPDQRIVDAVDRLFAMRRLKGASLAEMRTYAEGAGLGEGLVDRNKTLAWATLMVKFADPRRACRLLMLAHDFGCPLKLNAFELLAHELAETKQWREIPSVVSLSRRLCGRTSSRLLNWQARSWAEKGHFALLDGVLAGFEQEGLKPTRQTFHIVVAGHVRNRDLAKARECLLKMEKAGYRMDASTHAVIARAYRSLGMDQTVKSEALDSLPQLGMATATAVLNSLLQQTLDTDDLDGALAVLTHFYGPKAGTSQDVSSGGDTTRRDGVLGSAPSRVQGFKPDAATFTTILNYLAKQRNLPIALQVLQRMKSSGTPSDSALAAALIRVHCATGDLATALNIIASMCADLPETRPILNHLGWNAESSIGSDMQLSGVPVTTDVLNALLQGAMSRHRISGLRQVHRLMFLLGLRPNAETVTVVLNYLQRVEGADPQQLIDILRQLSKSVSPTLDHVHVVFRAIIQKEGELLRRGGWWALWRFRQAGYQSLAFPVISPPPESQRFDPVAGLTATMRRERLLLMPVVNSLSSRGVRADRATIQLRMRHDVLTRGDVEGSSQHLDAMLERGMHANKYHVAALMHGYILRGNMRMAENIFRSIDEANIAPNVVLFTILIAGYARQGKPVLALNAFRRMVTAGIDPDRVSIDVLASAWFAIGAVRMAREILIQLWPHVAPFPPELQDASTEDIARAFRKLPIDHRQSEYSPRSKHMLEQRMRLLMIAWRQWEHARSLRPNHHSIVPYRRRRSDTLPRP